MLMPVAIGLGFLLAFLAPTMHARLRERVGWWLGIYPLAVAVWAVTRLTSDAGPSSLNTVPWVPELGLALSFRTDGLSLLFVLLISLIGTVVVVYSSAYLRGHRDLGRFYAWLLVFMAAMLGVVTADNLLLLFVLWELTGISSYLLIGFGHDSASARRAALQALLVTGGGGLALLAGLILLGSSAGTFEISALLTQSDAIRSGTAYLPATGLILLGAFAKSAQFPFHFWLPNAMEAPTPVSAYLHSATMVKAGIYLMLRLSPILNGTDLWMSLVVGIGILTLLLGGWLSLTQTDLKRLLAYSTVSALGVMTLLIGLGTPRALEAAVGFVVAHAAYKGALFLVAGILDHETGTRDVRRLGGLRRTLPITAAAGGLAALSMAGLPPLLGFITKELTYEALLQDGAGGWLLAALVFGGVCFVVVAGAVGVAPFWLTPRTTARDPDFPDRATADHEASVSLWIGPILLGVFGLLAGLWVEPVGKLLLAPAASAVVGEADPLKLALWHGLTPALGLSVLTLLLGFAVFAVRDRIRERLAPVTLWMSNDLGFDRWLAGLNDVATAQTRLLQNGYLRYYLLMIVVATVGLVGGSLLARGIAWPVDVLEVQAHEAAIGALILIAALTSIRSRSRLSAVAALGVVGFGVSLIYLWYGAPDLAMTQFLIESLTVILFVLAFYHLPHYAKLSSVPARARDIVVALLTGGLMTALVLTVLAQPLFPSIADYYGRVAAVEAHGRNVVNVILVDFRGLDTLGEITVLGIAATGVFALLKLHPRRPAVASALQTDPVDSAVRAEPVETAP